MIKQYTNLPTLLNKDSGAFFTLLTIDYKNKTFHFNHEYKKLINNQLVDCPENFIGIFEYTALGEILTPEPKVVIFCKTNMTAKFRTKEDSKIWAKIVTFPQIKYLIQKDLKTNREVLIAAKDYSTKKQQHILAKKLYRKR